MRMGPKSFPVSMAGVLSWQGIRSVVLGKKDVGQVQASLGSIREWASPFSLGNQSLFPRLC